MAEGGRVSDLARADLGSVALRVPGSRLARDVLAAAGCPVAAPSANRSGRVSPTDVDHVLGDLDGRIAAEEARAKLGEVGLSVPVTGPMMTGTWPTAMHPGSAGAAGESAHDGAGDGDLCLRRSRAT